MDWHWETCLLLLCTPQLRALITIPRIAALSAAVICIMYVDCFLFFSPPPGCALHPCLYHCAQCHLLKTHRHHSERLGSEGRYYSCIGLSVDSRSSLKWMWSWLMSYLASTDRWLDQHPALCVASPVSTSVVAVKDCARPRWKTVCVSCYVSLWLWFYFKTKVYDKSINLIDFSACPLSKCLDLSVW